MDSLPSDPSASASTESEAQDLQERDEPQDRDDKASGTKDGEVPLLFKVKRALSFTDIYVDDSSPRSNTLTEVKLGSRSFLVFCVNE